MLERLLSDVSPQVARLLDGALSGRELSAEDALRLMQSEAADLQALTRAADVARAEDVGADVSFVINRNINFTNVCYTGCSYCGFSRHRDDEDAYDRSLDEIAERARDAVARGASEVCIQGGIDPRKDHHHYHQILLRLKREFPDLHIHAYSPEEIDFGHKKSGMSLEAYLTWLKEAGLGTIPGTAAEILDDEVRNRLAPRRLMTERWVEIVKAAHASGLRSSATIMYGHIESRHQVVNHLKLLRDLQKESGGFTEFVPLGFIHEKNRLGHRLGTRPGPSAADDLRLISVARLFFRPWITNIQVSWVKMGLKLSQLALLAGANDFGGTLMEESISRESGAQHGENLSPEEIRRLIREMGRVPVQRGTTYEILRRFDDPALDPPSMEPGGSAEISGPRRWRESDPEQSRRSARVEKEAPVVERPPAAV